MTNDKAVHAAILAGFKRANVGRMHFRMAAIIEAAVADRERERCATECERRHANGNFAHDTREDCALAIRALGDEQ